MENQHNNPLHSGQLYFPMDPSILDLQNQWMEKLYDFNQTRPSQGSLRNELLADMFASFGENSYIEPPLRANWGGKHVHMGKGVYANFNFTLVDDTYIYIGDHCMFGPNVTLATAGHPLDASLRCAAYQYNMPVKIGNNCWLGAGVVVLPGVTIGDNVVIGAGSIVTKDIPSNVLAFGNPCQIYREIGDHDRQYYYKNWQIDPSMWDQVE